MKVSSNGNVQEQMARFNVSAFSGAKAINASVLDTSKSVSSIANAPKDDFKHSVFFNIITFGIGYAIVHAQDKHNEAMVKDLKEGSKELLAALTQVIRNKGESFGTDEEGKTSTCEIKMADKETVKLRVDSGVLFARLEGSDEEYRLDASPEQLRLKLAEDMFAHPDVFTNDDLNAVVDEVEPKDNQARNYDMTTTEDSFRRRVYMLAVMSRSNVGAHRLENVSTSSLRGLATIALQPGHADSSAVDAALRQSLEELDKIIYADRFNTIEADSLIHSFRNQPDAVKKDVKIGEKFMPAQDESDIVPQSYRDLMADLVLAVGQIKGGELDPENLEAHDILFKALAKHADTFARVFTANDGDSNGLQAILDKMPEDDNMRGPLSLLNKALKNNVARGFVISALGLNPETASDRQTVSNAIRDTAKWVSDHVNGRKRMTWVDHVRQDLQIKPFCASVIEELDKGINDVIDFVQVQIQDTLGPENADSPKIRSSENPGAKPKSIDEMMREVDSKSDSGAVKFFKDVVRLYAMNSSPIDKASMVAAAVRYSKSYGKAGLTNEMKAARSEQEIVAFLKGAGPLLHKMLQGTPSGVLPPEFEAALKAVKKNLAPIPEEFVKACLADIKLRSGGKITEIEAVKNLGAASVGEALLCRLKGPGYPPEGKEVVVKMLRPDALMRIQREKELMLTIAKESNMRETYAGQLDTILEEFDFTHEADNIRLGEIYDKGSPRVKAVKCESIVAETPSVLIMEKAEGKTASDVIDVADKILKKLEGIDANDTEEIKKGAKELKDAYLQLQTMQKDLADMSKQWATEAIFGAGVFHGDLHAGNLILDPKKGLTMIDFGNVTKLTEEQQKQLTRVVAAACAGDKATDIFLDGLKKLLGEDVTGKWSQEVGENVRKAIGEVLSVGDKSDTGKRIYVILARLQNMGIKIPDPIFKFSQSQIRLQNTIDGVNQRLAAMRSRLGTLMNWSVPVAKNSNSADIFSSVYTLCDKFSQDFTSMPAHYKKVLAANTVANHRFGKITSYVQKGKLTEDIANRLKQFVDIGVNEKDTRELERALIEYDKTEKELEKLKQVQKSDDVNAAKSAKEKSIDELLGAIREKYESDPVDVDGVYLQQFDNVMSQFREALMKGKSMANALAEIKKGYPDWFDRDGSDKGLDGSYSGAIEAKHTVVTEVLEVLDKKASIRFKDLEGKVEEYENQLNGHGVSQDVMDGAKKIASMEQQLNKNDARIRELAVKVQGQALNRIYEKYLKPMLADVKQVKQPKDFLEIMSEVVMQNAVAAMKRVDPTLVKIMC